MAGNTATPGASLVARTLSVLAAFDDRRRRLTLAELARRADLPLATTHRIVRELVAGGALVRGESGRYAIGRLIWDLGLLAAEQTGLRQIASPFLHDIYAATLATVHLAIRDGNQVLYVERLSGRASVPVLSRAGSRLPMNATGVGKVLLAHAPQDVRDEVLASLVRMTPFTITSPDQLREQLVRVRQDGFATTMEEMSLGACSVAVPIVAPVMGPATVAPTMVGPATVAPVVNESEHGQVVAAIGIVVPTLKRDRSRLVAALQVAAQGISRSLPRT